MKRLEMWAYIENFRGVKSAEFPLGKITVIAGDNGAGKSSVAQALAAALTGQCPIPGVKKSDLHRFVHAGQTTARAQIVDFGGAGPDSGCPLGETIITYPEGKAYKEGKPPVSSPYAAGLDSPLDMEPRRASEAWRGILNAAPPLETLKQALQEGGNLGPEVVDAVVGMVKARGFDGGHQFYRDEGTRLKGRWEQATGDRYGSKKAETWRPEGFSFLLAARPKDELESAVKEAEAAHRAAIAKAAVNINDRAQLERDAAKLETAEAAFDQVRAEHEAALEAAQAAQDELDSSLPELPPIVLCPHCGEALELRGGQVIKSATITEAELGKRAARREELSGKLKAARDDEIGKRLKLNAAEREFNAADMASKRLARLPDKAEAVDPAPFQAEAEQARRNLALWESAHIAADLHRQILSLLAVIEILAPEGLRKRHLEKSRGEFNFALSGLTTAAGWEPVILEADLSVSFGGRPYPMLSESEQYRARATIQAAIALRDGSEVLIFDRADIMTGPGRRGLWALSQKTGLNSVIFLSASSPDEVKGKKIWLEGGCIASGASL